MSQITCINKPLDMNLSLEEIEDQLASSTKNRNIKRPQCLLNKMTLTGKTFLKKRTPACAPAFKCVQSFVKAHI